MKIPFDLIWLIKISDKIDLPVKWRQKINCFLKFLEYFWLLLVIFLLTLLHFFLKSKTTGVSIMLIILFILSYIKVYLSRHFLEILTSIFMSEYVPLRYQESIIELKKEIKNWDKKLNGNWDFLIKNKKSNLLDWIVFGKKKILTTFKTIDEFGERFSDAIKFFLTRTYLAISSQYFVYFLIPLLILSLINLSLIKNNFILLSLFCILLGRFFAFGIIKEILYTDLEIAKIIGYNNWENFAISTKNSKELLGIYIENKNIKDKILFFIFSWPFKLSLETRKNFLKIKLITEKSSNNTLQRTDNTAHR